MPKTSIVAALTAIFVASGVSTAWAKATVEAVHQFGGDDGCAPRAALVMDQKGNFYGGADCGPTNTGVVFEFTSNGKYKLLSDFSDPHVGSFPIGRLLLAPKGEIYGVTAMGGDSDAGTVYKITRKGQMTVLHSFTGGADGGVPLQGVSLDAQGNIYGTASKGGNSSFDGGYGVVYKITPQGEYSVLHAFNGSSDGSSPSGELLSDGKGNFFSMTQKGGPQESGVVYKMTSGGIVTTIHAFSHTEGYFSSGVLIADETGNLYGTTTAGGDSNVGTVYKTAPDGTTTVLHSFGYFPYCFGHNPCGDPNGGLMLKDGALYGVTDHITYDKPIDGTVFRINADGTFEILFSFSHKNKLGYLPNGPLVLGLDGALYGTNESGGKGGNMGTIFKVTNFDTK